MLASLLIGAKSLDVATLPLGYKDGLSVAAPGRVFAEAALMGPSGQNKAAASRRLKNSSSRQSAGSGRFSTRGGAPDW